MASFIQWLPHPPEGVLISDILVLGYIGSMAINLIVGVSVIFLFIIGKLKNASIPLWLLIVNLFFFLLQLILLIINQK